MADVVTTALAGMGPAGAAIAVLMTVVTALVGAIVYLFKQNTKLHIERRAESLAVIKLIESNNTALTKVADSTDERNRVTQELAEAIKAQAQAFEMVNQRIEFYHDGNIEKLKDLATAFASHADAVRVNTAMVAEARNASQAAVAGISDVRVKLEVLAARRTR
ncbi:hypothetical protein ABIF65_003867 [Bradyrhizobium japonicum]|uniref:hypothetical protein n=1 Tax=Bradyrhizobium TaxID=374 RepID=UPI0012BBECFC|nr:MULTISPECIES: hypothetical protein [Bradyrhizobium]MBR1004551.1 hypothetical protein [Bradyrhizobium liaoningense]MCP1741694.1 hypothetical protein [Bradyrhizobium japonicum]MCP1779483.1 hypothetical protein [Bradyrhizobium japonicum]MCP1859404.1 hypothetical protein [Bradyrhizobium japonicum]MCP1890171.1 hypothetical protein [Bradyrhizobium japonicum]